MPDEDSPEITPAPNSCARDDEDGDDSAQTGAIAPEPPPEIPAGAAPENPPPDDGAPTATAPVMPADADEPVPGSRRMGLGDHIMELRARLIICVLTMGAAVIFGFCFYRLLWGWALLPRDWAALSIGKPPNEIVPIQLRSPMDSITQVAKLAIDFALILTMPMLVYQVWGFVSPGLKPKEKRAFLPVFIFGSLLFLLGVATAFFFALPLGLEFLIRFSATLPGSKNFWSLNDYLNFVGLGCLGFGLCFETPLVMLALGRLGLITPEGILKRWRHSILVMTVLGAAFTPPDPVTLIILTGIMVVLFFLGYFLVKWAAPKKTKE